MAFKQEGNQRQFEFLRQHINDSANAILLVPNEWFAAALGSGDPYYD
jgi:hypothetical protein